MYTQYVAMPGITLSLCIISNGTSFCKRKHRILGKCTHNYIVITGISTLHAFLLLSLLLLAQLLTQQLLGHLQAVLVQL